MGYIIGNVIGNHERISEILNRHQVKVVSKIRLFYRPEIYPYRYIDEVSDFLFLVNLIP